MMICAVALLLNFQLCTLGYGFNSPDLHRIEPEPEVAARLLYA